MTRTKNPVRFGINTAFRSFDEALRVCKAAEASGFTTIGFSDRMRLGSLPMSTWIVG